MMYKITRLYTQGIRKEQEPVMAFQVEFGKTLGSDTAIASTKGWDVVPRLIRAMVCDMNTLKRQFQISGIETQHGEQDDVLFAQVWRVEEVE